MPGGGQSPSVLFRVDSSARIGSGHLHRCVTLANELRKRGSRCAFIARAHPGNMNAIASAAGHPLQELPAPDGDAGGGYDGWLGVTVAQDAAETIRAIRDLGAEGAALVLDHYALAEAWERLLRPHVDQILVIDDLANRRHEVDVLVDVLPDPSGSRYEGLLPHSARLLSGPDYALLRPEFRALRRGLSTHDGLLRRVLISFGAVDAANHCMSAAAVVREALGPDVEIDIAVGAVGAHLSALKEWASHDPKMRLHVDTPAMADLMTAADLAIGAGGTTSWERLCLGLPTIVSAIAENQADTLQALVEAGCAFAAPADRTLFEARVAEILAVLATQPAVLRAMSRMCQRAVDGRGAERVAKAIATPKLTASLAIADDARDLWQWRNEDRVRASSKSSEHIEWAQHEAWFESALADPNRSILICREHGIAVAVVRFDIVDDLTEISVYLTPGAHGRGLGPAALAAGERWLRDARPEVRRIRAEILPDNASSIAAFIAAGYEQRLLTFERDLARGIDS